MHDLPDQLNSYLGAVQDLRQRGASEASIRDRFLHFLRDAFPRLEQTDPIELEKHIPALRVRGGFADALYGDLIFEFKKILDGSARADGLEELGRYIRNQKHPERFLGILTDGQNLEVYALRNASLDKVDELRLSADRAEDVKLWLDCYLFHEKNLVPTANDVALRFGDRSPTFWRSLRVLESLWRHVADDAGAQTKFAEWQSLLSIVYGSAVGDEALFMRHTYLALFARTLAFVALERRAPNNGELADILTGAAFERMGFDNFVGDDFFTWVADASCRADTRALLRAVATRLTAAYDLTEIHEDLLKELYQELVDPQTRHDLGEFYTPDWLAELTLRKAGFPPSPGAADDSASLLDPACGSGTFLFTAVRLLRESGLRGPALVGFCAERLAGVDVHPLAVTIAKTNLLLALGEDLRGGARRFGLPVYMADTLSARAATTKPDPVRDALEVPVDVDTIAKRSGKKKGRLSSTTFEIPVVLARRPALLSDLLDALLRFADPTVGEKDAWTGFQKRLRDLGAAANHDHYWSRNLGLMRWLLQPPTTDTVWRFILRNACQPQLLAERKFAFVVGNPPWLSYRYIARPDYQTRVRELVFFYDLLGRKQSHLFTQMELATLFFAFCTDLYLADAGTLAFVMPRSILTGAKQHGNFRNQYVASARLLIDCEQVSPLFNVPACVVIWQKRVGTDGPLVKAADSRIPMIRLRGDLPSRNASYAEATHRLMPSETTYAPPTAAGRSPYFDEVTQGATIVPRCLWFVRPPESARTIDYRQPQLETDTATERQAKPPWKGIRLSGSVEADFLYATLLSDHMVPFGWRRLSLVILPLVEGPDGQMSLLDERAAIREGKPGLADWLRSADRVWLQYRKSRENLLDYLNWQSKLTRQRPKGVAKLLYNTSGTHLCACVVDTTTINDWSIHGLPVRGFAGDTTTYWLETRNPEEAHYLCAVLNAGCVDDLIKPFQTKGAFGAQQGKGERHIHRRPFEVLPIPRYSASDDHHRELARLSQQCHEAVARYLSTADATVLNMPIGRLRTLIRTDLLKDELKQIDALTARIVSER